MQSGTNHNEARGTGLDPLISRTCAAETIEPAGTGYVWYLSKGKQSTGNNRYRHNFMDDNYTEFEVKTIRTGKADELTALSPLLGPLALGRMSAPACNRVRNDYRFSKSANLSQDHSISPVTRSLTHPFAQTQMGHSRVVRDSPHRTCLASLAKPCMTNRIHIRRRRVGRSIRTNHTDSRARAYVCERATS